MQINSPQTEPKVRDMFEGGAASAVNMKTGQPVFSLDFNVAGRATRPKVKIPALMDRKQKTKKIDKSGTSSELQTEPLQVIVYSCLLKGGRGNSSQLQKSITVGTQLLNEV